MSLTIYTDNSISIDNHPTGLKVVQVESGTIVYTPENILTKTHYKEHKMPHARYTLSHDFPKSSSPNNPSVGRIQFEADILALVARLKSEVTDSNIITS